MGKGSPKANDDTAADFSCQGLKALRALIRNFWAALGLYSVMASVCQHVF